jgi:hypothetical protein
MIYRRFGYVQARLLLEKQDDLRYLEDKLDILDSQDSFGDRDVLLTRSNYEEPRKELMARLEKTFIEYGKLRWCV